MFVVLIEYILVNISRYLESESALYISTWNNSEILKHTTIWDTSYFFNTIKNLSSMQIVRQRVDQTLASIPYNFA